MSHISDTRPLLCLDEREYSGSLAEHAGVADHRVAGQHPAQPLGPPDLRVGLRHRRPAPPGARQARQRITAVLMPDGPDGHDADELRRIILDRYDMSLGAGLAKLAGRVFRIGHLGHSNDLTLAGTLAGVQTGLHVAGVPVKGKGVDAAADGAPASGRSEATG